MDLSLLKHDQALLVSELGKLGASIPDPGKMFRCPWHDDPIPSAHIHKAKDGSYRVKCFGCNVNFDVLDIMAQNAGLDTAEYMRREAQRENPKPATPAKAAAVRSEQTAIYYYNLPDGSPLYRKLRIEFFDAAGNRTKKLTPFERFDNGRWIGGEGCMSGVQRVLYRNEQIQFRQRIFICEGEKCCDLLWDFGILATCNDGGAGKWKPEFSRALIGKDVVILPDNDAIGREHAEAVAESLIGLAKSIRLVELPGLAVKGDVYDWIYEGAIA